MVDDEGYAYEIHKTKLNGQKVYALCKTLQRENCNAEIELSNGRAFILGNHTGHLPQMARDFRGNNYVEAKVYAEDEVPFNDSLVMRLNE